MPRDRNIQIYFRIFPMKDTQGGLIKIEDSTMYIRSIQDLSQDQIKYWEFKSDGIFNNASQEHIYSRVMNGLLDRIVGGLNGVIVGFGQTGTGKSFTLGGLQYTELEYGIAPRVILELFKLKSELSDNIKMSIQMSYTEFSKTSVVDLFKDFPNSIDAWHVKRATKIIVRSEYEALTLLYKGEGRKTFSKNNVYLSHISSSVLTFHITTANYDFSCPEKISSRLHIIDMAGVDSVGNTSSDFKSPLDIGKANVIMSHLEQFILYLMENVPEHIQVKERTNPLIYFLGSDLSNESILRFIGHVNIQKAALKITLSTLRFGQLVRGLKPKIRKIQSEINEDVKIKYLQHKLDCLQKEKIYNSVLMNQDLTKDINHHRMEHIRGMIDAYLHNRVTELNVLNVVEASEAFKVFKGVCNITEEEKVKIQDTDCIKVKRDSKSGSKGSIKAIKSSSKKIKKSKESLIGVEKLKPQSSNMSLQRKRSLTVSRSTSKLSSAKTTVSQSNVGKMKSNGSIIGKPPSVIITRKSTSSYNKDKKDQKPYLTDTTMIPDMIPKYYKAWHMFTTDIKSTYKIFHESYKANENELKRVYIDYQKHVAKLRLYKEILEKKQDELLEAKMYQHYVSVCKPDDKSVDPGKLCQTHLSNARAKLLVQQEIVLKLQGEMKLCLNKRREIKQNLRDDFDIYCRENYSVTIVGLDEMDEEFLLKEETFTFELTGEEEMEEEQHKCVQKSPYVARLSTLKKIMQTELRKNIKLKQLKNRRWMNYALKY